jgi:hypothetical protein
MEEYVEVPLDPVTVGTTHWPETKVTTLLAGLVRFVSAA